MKGRRFTSIKNVEASSLHISIWFFNLRVHGCHITHKHRACTLLRRVSRVPQGCYAFDKFSREFSAKYHRKRCKLSSEGENSLAYIIHSA